MGVILIQKGDNVSLKPDTDYMSESCCTIVAVVQYLTIPENRRRAPDTRNLRADGERKTPPWMCPVKIKTHTFLVKPETLRSLFMQLLA